MSITVIDYGSGNLKSAAKALEAAAKNININSKIIVSSDPKIISQSDKIVLPGQGSFKACREGINNITGLNNELNESVLIKNKPEEILKLAVKRMLPTGALAKKQLSKLKIYKGTAHPHESQNPKIIEFSKLNKKNYLSLN